MRYSANRPVATPFAVSDVVNPTSLLTGSKITAVYARSKDKVVPLMNPLALPRPRKIEPDESRITYLNELLTDSRGTPIAIEIRPLRVVTSLESLLSEYASPSAFAESRIVCNAILSLVLLVKDLAPEPSSS
jgi:hypothetical protein